MKLTLEFNGVEEANGALYGDRYFAVLNDFMTYIKEVDISAVNAQELVDKYRGILDLHGLPHT
jgi:hypothetical protein